MAEGALLLQIPVDVLYASVCKYLNPRELLALGGVCWYLYRAARHDRAWAHLFRHFQRHNPDIVNLFDRFATKSNSNLVEPKPTKRLKSGWTTPRGYWHTFVWILMSPPDLIPALLPRSFNLSATVLRSVLASVYRAIGMDSSHIGGIRHPGRYRYNQFFRGKKIHIGCRWEWCAKQHLYDPHHHIVCCCAANFAMRLFDVRTWSSAEPLLLWRFHSVFLLAAPVSQSLDRLCQRVACKLSCVVLGARSSNMVFLQ